MAKHRKKKQAVYHNTNADNWTNDTKEQLSLIPGSDGYEARQQQLSANSPMSEENMEGMWEEQMELEKQEYLESRQLAEEFQESFTGGQRSPGVMQYRSMLQRSDAVKQTARIASEALGRTVSEKEIEQANHGITVMPDDVPKALKNYEQEFHEREIPTVDTNHDGKIDEDDAYMMPGMSKMRRYL